MVCLLFESVLLRVFSFLVLVFFLLITSCYYASGIGKQKPTNKIDSLTELFRQGDFLDSKQELSIQHELANELNEHKRYDEALYYYYQLLESYTFDLDTQEMARLHEVIGLIYFNQNLLFKAANTLNEAVILYDAIGRKNSSYARIYISVVYMELENWRAAENCLNSTIDYYSNNENSGDSTNLGVAYLNLGLVSEQQSKLEIAEQSYLTAIDIFFDLNDKSANLLTGYYGLIYTWLKQGKVTFAKQKIEELESLAEYDRADFEIDRMIFEALIWIQSGNVNKAAAQLRKIDERFLELEHEPILKEDVFRMKLSFYRMTRNYLEICNLYRIRVNYNESVKKLELARYFTTVEANRKLTKEVAGNKIKLASNQVNLDREQLVSKHRWALILAAVILLSLFIASYIFHRRYRILDAKNDIEQFELQQERMIGQIWDVSTVLASYGLTSARKEEFISSLSSTLREIKSKSQASAELETLTVLIDQHLSDSQEPIQLEFETALRNQGFRNRLVQLHPKLSIQDHGLCALIVSGLTYKEIAKQKKASLSSIDRSGSRLRKKMGIQPSVSLVSYLQSI